MDLNLDELAKELSTMAKSKGFWELLEGDAALNAAALVDATKSSKIALMHSELSELLERVRETIGGELPMSDKIPAFSGEEEELADLIIRALDYAGYFNLRITKAIYAKMAYNAGRPHKHGKAF